MSHKLLSVTGLPSKLQERIREVAQEGGYEAVFVPNELHGHERDEFIVREIVDADILVGGMLAEAQFQAAQKLRWIHVPFAGVNRLLETKALVESDIVITNSAGVSAGPLSDQIMGYIIMHARRLLEQWEAQKRGEWRSNWEGTTRPLELAGLTVGIVGYGSIGKELARRARAFGMRVIANKNNPSGNYPELDEILGTNELPRLLETSDYVVIAAPYTPQTHRMIGKAQLAMMKRTGYLINIGRGALVNETELIEALKEGLIGGAALDVFETEPLPSDSPLWKIPRVVITPHSSGNFSNFLPTTVEFYCKNLRRWFANEPLLNIVDKHRGY